jgi:hypothetical protein
METEKSHDAQIAHLSAQEKIKILDAFSVLQDYACRINEAKGWHSPAPSDAQCALTVHEEAAELGRYFRDDPEKASPKIPEFLGVEEEGADVIIRVMSWFRRRGWRLGEATLAKLEHNCTRPVRHGGKLF